MPTVKSTVNLDKKLKEQLEILVKEEKISSLTEGINNAIYDYLKKMKRLSYEMKMKEAASDKAFMARTMRIQKEFEGLDRDNNLCDEEW